MKKITTLLAATAALSVPQVTYADAILHAFNWKYSDVTNNAANRCERIQKGSDFTCYEI